MPKLAVHVSEQVGVVPALKTHEFVLVSVDDKEIDITKVIDSIRNFLKLLEKEKDFAITAKNYTISIISLNQEGFKDTDKNIDPFFVCTHCGHITIYESVHKNHEKLHYIGGA